MKHTTSIVLFFILQDGFSALMWASKGGHTEIVLLLLDHLAEINVVNVVSCALFVTTEIVHQVRQTNRLWTALKKCMQWVQLSLTMMTMYSIGSLNCYLKGTGNLL